jgi:hypothetical protein
MVVVEGIDPLPDAVLGARRRRLLRLSPSQSSLEAERDLQ